MVISNNADNIAIKKPNQYCNHTAIWTNWFNITTLTSVPKVKFSGFHYIVRSGFALNVVYRKTSSSIENNSFSFTNILLQPTEECCLSYGKEKTNHKQTAHILGVKCPHVTSVLATVKGLYLISR